MMRYEKWIALGASALAAACPVAIGLQGQPVWIIVLSAAGTAAGVVVGRLALSKPEDTRYIDALTAGTRPLSERRIPE